MSDDCNDRVGYLQADKRYYDSSSNGPIPHQLADPRNTRVNSASDPLVQLLDRETRRVESRDPIRERVRQECFSRLVVRDQVDDTVVGRVLKVDLRRVECISSIQGRGDVGRTMDWA